MINKLSSDQELWLAVKQDDIKAFNVLFDRHWQKVFTTVFSVTDDREVCSEIVHDIFLNIWLKREQLNISYFKAYLTASARYSVYRHIKNFKRNPVTYTEDMTLVHHLSINNLADEDIRYRELETELDTNLEVLPKRCQEIFALSRKEQLSNDEIAKRLNISKRTVENQLTHALHHLRLAMKSFLILLASVEFFDLFR